MANLSGPQLTQLAIQAGFPAGEAQTASAVALAESSGNPNAISVTNDFGVMQINKSAHPELFRQFIWNDPLQNMRMALVVFQQAGNKWSPWSTYKSGRYKLFMSQTGSANSGGVAGAGGALGLGTQPIDPSSADIAVGTTNFIAAASDPVFWTRVAMFIGGVVLALVGLHGLLNLSSSYRKVTGHVASLASKAAAVAV